MDVWSLEDGGRGSEVFLCFGAEELEVRYEEGVGLCLVLCQRQQDDLEG